MNYMNVMFLSIKQDIVQATRMLPYIGAKTNTAGALQLLANSYDTSYGGRDPNEVLVQRVAVLVVNGQSTLNQPQVRDSITAMCVCVCVYVSVSVCPLELATNQDSSNRKTGRGDIFTSS